MRMERSYRSDDGAFSALFFPNKTNEIDFSKGYQFFDTALNKLSPEES